MGLSSGKSLQFIKLIKNQESMSINLTDRTHLAIIVWSRKWFYSEATDSPLNARLVVIV